MSRWTARRRLALTVTALACALATACPSGAQASVRLEGRSVLVDGLATAYAMVGPDEAPPLLLLNGTGSPMSQWDPALLRGLSMTRRVVVYDYPGLGGSAPLPSRSGTLTFDALAAHAEGLLTALQLPAVDVLGWSMGGFVAQRLVVRSPERVRRLVLAGTNPGGPHAVLGPTWVQEQDSAADGSLRGYVRTNYPRGARERGWAFIRRVNAAIESGRYPADRVPAATYDAMVAAEEPWLASGANLAQLDQVHQPTLVITGADDVVTPPRNSRLLAAAIPRARLLLVPGAGHSFLFQRPFDTARSVADFLSR